MTLYKVRLKPLIVIVPKSIDTHLQPIYLDQSISLSQVPALQKSKLTFSYEIVKEDFAFSGSLKGRDIQKYQNMDER